ncbi:hypothetical protein MA16_Dca004174 [Dendrobium catenatum]|uniref:Uncharacterized protein n=1 Tax=Dendrobium catenatum TaxID=906689 RepID=A0A2I0X2M5_9ASPA|nr:hypothetical protein MA16_Dca004174 [Dendrobium catenatum]
MLKRRIMRALRINYTTTTINLTCRLRNNGGFCAIHVTDDEVCEYMLMEARSQAVVVYVEIEQISPIEVAAPTVQAYMCVTTIVFHDSLT